MKFGFWCSNMADFLFIHLNFHFILVSIENWTSDLCIIINIFYLIGWFQNYSNFYTIPLKLNIVDPSYFKIISRKSLYQIDIN